MERFYRLTRLPETCWGRYSKSSTNKCQSTGWMVQSLETILVSVWSCCQRNFAKVHIQCITYRRPLLGPCWKHLLTLSHWRSKDLCWPKYFQQGEGPVGASSEYCEVSQSPVDNSSVWCWWSGEGSWMVSGWAAACRQQTHLSPRPRPAVINYLECGTVIVIVIHIWYGRYFSTNNQPRP